MAQDKEKNATKRFKTPWFWWCAAICLATCFAAASWAGITYLFSFPEKPKNYALLEKLGHLPTPLEIKSNGKIEDSGKVEGESLSSVLLHSKFLSFPPAKREQLNLQLRRQLISGLRDRELLYFIEDTFEILQVRDLTPDDFVTEGIIVQAQASIRPDEYRPPSRYPLIIEYILPGAKSSQKIFYPKGKSFELKKASGFCTILHAAERVINNERTIIITAIPIIKGVQKTPEQKNIRVQLPEKYNVEAEFPAFNY